MSKRSTFEKIPKDFYATIDPKAVAPMAEKFKGLKYASPCYGNGDLEDRLMDIATCVWRSDIRETVGCSKVLNGLDINKEDVKDADVVIENPPFSKNVLLPLIEHWVTLKPTWLLLPWDILQNKYMRPYVGIMQEAVPIGRLYWMPNKVRGTDNYAFILFEDRGSQGDKTVRINYGS